MTQRFILDQNIPIFAQREINQLEEPGLTCSDLLTEIIRICHTLVVDPSLWANYIRQLNQPRHLHPQKGTFMLRTLAGAIQRADKVDLLSVDAPPFPEENRIPQGSRDDITIVRLAVETGAALVTTDGDLRIDLNSSGVQEQYNLEVLSPEQALDIL